MGLRGKFMTYTQEIVARHNIPTAETVWGGAILEREPCVLNR